MQKHLLYFRSYDIFRALWIPIFLLWVTFSPNNVLAGNAANGEGTMTVTPTTVCAGSTGNSYVFTFTKPTGDFQAGSQTTVVIPSGWTAPQNTLSGSPGYVSVTATGSGSAATIASVSGTGPWTITLNMTLTASGSFFTLTYGGGGTAVTNPSAGTYTFTTKTKQNGGTLTNIATQPVITSTALPVATFSYTGSPYCKNAANPSPTFSGGGVAGTFSSTAGLVFVSTSTGQVNIASSTPGTYTVTNTIAAAGGCGVVTASSSITITALPVATFSYTATPYCQGASNPSPTFSGGGVAGTFSSTAGLVFVSTATGQVNLAASTPGTYTVTNTIGAANGCAQVTATSPISITVVPTASISYAGIPFCKSIATGQAVTLTGTGAYSGGTYTASPAGLTINSGTGAIIPGTSTAGTYTVTYTVPASGGCSSLAVTTSVTITAVPMATINYDTPFCMSISTPQSVTLSGTGAYTGGSFSATEGISIDGNGDVTPGTSAAGTYTVTYMIPTSGGCAAVPVTTSVTITEIPTAGINYPGSPYCTSLASSQPVSLTGTGAYTGGTYSSTAGLTLNSSNGDITPGTSTDGTYTITYAVPASGGCAGFNVTASADIFGPTATISYSSTSYCSTVSTPQSVSLTGTGSYAGGTFSAPAGLTIDGITGDITPGTSIAGTYSVTYTIPGTGSCADVLATTSVTITTLPVATFSYTGTPYCTSESNPSPTFSGGGVAGTFSSTAGLVFVSISTGQVNLASSTPGTYTVTNTITAAGGCATVTASGSITVTALPVATFSYTANPFCQSAADPSPAFSGGGVAGTFSSTGGLVFVNTSTGQVDLTSSTPGTYTVTNTIAAGNGCAQVTATSPITITVVPTASISYAGTPFCKSIATGQAVSLTGTGAYTGGTYTASPAGLTINSGTGAITPGTSIAGTYTVTYTVPASGGCAAVTASASITVTALPVATFSYTATPFCQSAANPSPTFSGGGVAGTFSSTAGLVFVSTATGQVNLSASTPGTYTVTNTIAAANGCAQVTATSPISITVVPTASISYAGTPFCKSIATGQAVTLTGTGAYTGGTYTASPAGLTINSGTGAITPSTSTAGTYTVTYTVPASGGCSALAVTTSVTITAVPTSTINYATPFCITLATPQSATLTGTGAYTGGTYTSPAGLSLDGITGAITPGTSTAGTYTVTYTIPASGGCAAVAATKSVTITAVPTAAISYAGTPFCKSLATGQAVTLTGTGAYTGGTYTASPAGLTINSGTGAITPSTSTAGTYTVTYTVPASGGCAAVPVTTSATITAVPTATINYATPFCISVATPQSVTLTGTGAYTGGTYTSPAGLSLDGTTGAITPGTSTAGTYTVTYTIPASGGCAAVAATKSVTITAVPTAAISYAGTPFCKSLATGQAVTLTGTGAYTGGTYTATPAGLTITSGSGAITPSTSTAGSYTITYTVPASGGCASVAVTTSVMITAVPTANISYAGTPFCITVATAQPVTLTGTNAYTGGTFSAPAGLTINSISGAITPGSSTAGTRTVTYTIPASAGCAAVPVTTSVTVNAVPTASISYAGAPFCTSAGAKTVTLTGTGMYTGGIYSAPAGLTINAANGTITPTTSSAGTYTITYTTTTSSGCAAQTATTSVTITSQPVATFSYAGSPYYKGVANPFPTFGGGGVAGTFSSTAGLVFVSTSTGQVNLSASTPGTYIVTNTIGASGGCAAVTDTGIISIVVDFRSATTGNWNNASSWEMYNGIAWSVATTSPSYDFGTITIRSGHTITVTSGVTVDQVTIDAGGQVTLGSGTFTVNDGTGTDITVNGTIDINSNLTLSGLSIIEIKGTGILRNSGNLDIPNGTSVTVASGGIFRRDGGIESTGNVTFWNINSGGTYRHNMDGDEIPKATWDANSTLEITGVITTVPGQLAQPFGNFTWNNTSQTGNVNTSNNLTSIAGNFTMTSTGTGSLKLSSSGANGFTAIGGYYYHNGGKLYITESGNWDISVANDFNMTGGSFFMADGTAVGDGKPTLFVTGNANVTGGVVDMSQYAGTSSGKGIGTWVLYSHFTYSGGSIITSSTGVGYGLIQFAGSTTQNFIGTASFAGKVDFEVLGNATLNLSTYIISGGRNFTLDALGSVLLKDANGITKTTLSGNVQTTGTRSYSTDGLYTYNGTSAQVTGDGLPPIVNSLTVDNSAGATLTNSVVVNYNLNMPNGNITTLDDTLGLGFNNSNTGVLTRTTTMIYGYFKRWIRSNFTGGYLYPLGYNGAYRGMQLNYTATASTGDYVLGYYSPGDPGNNGLPLTEDGITFTNAGPEGWWNLYPYGSIASGGAYTLDLYPWGYFGIVDYTALRIVRRVNAASPWTFTGTHVPGTGSNLQPIAHRANLSVYGQFDVLKIPGAPLPVELVDFTAKLVDEKVLINWKTASEINNAYFTVERSADGINYTTVAKLAGAGNSSQANYYYAVDNQPIRGVSYYRLKQTDYDEKETIYPPVAINLSLLQSIVIFPNPSNGNTTYIAFPNNLNDGMAIEVTDLAGKRIFSRMEYPQGNSVTELDPQKLLHPGAYFVTIMLSNEAIVQKVIISE